MTTDLVYYGEGERGGGGRREINFKKNTTIDKRSNFEYVTHVNACIAYMNTGLLTHKSLTRNTSNDQNWQ